jgi:hypothetical protein
MNWIFRKHSWGNKIHHDVDARFLRWWLFDFVSSTSFVGLAACWSGSFSPDWKQN